MLPFIKSIFGARSLKSTGKKDCGNGCVCAARAYPVDLEISQVDKALVSQLSDKFVVGKITQIDPHPDPKVTKVQITQCDLGNGRIEQILCGGTNIKVGAIVPIATVGADLGGGFVIGERAIRGEMSHGMICAKEELGLDPGSEKKGEIWLMPTDLAEKLGTPLNQL